MSIRVRGCALAAVAAMWGVLAPGASARTAATACSKPLPPVVIARPQLDQPTFSWNDPSGYRAQAVHFWSRTCAVLGATVYAPVTIAPGARLPGVIVLPPSGGVSTQEQVAYLATYLADNGYITMTVDPQGLGQSDWFGSPVCGTAPGYSNPSPCPGVPFQTMDNWMETARSALDYFLSSANPLAASLDTANVGIAGHSLGARAASYVQDPFFDTGDAHGAPRVQAVVGLDNLSSNYYGDASAAGGGTAANGLVVGQLPGDHPIAINVPGLGLASDGGGDPDTKKFSYSQWKAAGVPSGMIVFAGVGHDDFSQATTSDEAMLHRFASITKAWFDRWLRNDSTALDAVLAGDVSYLSTAQHSAWFLPGDGITGCEDWRSQSSSKECTP